MISLNPYDSPLFIYLFIYCPFRAAPTVYAGSQASGQMGAVAGGLCHSHSNTRSEPQLRPTPQLTVMPDF